MDISNPWQSSMAKDEKNLNMLDKEIQCDVTFTFKAGRGKTSSVGAHTFILIRESPVFETMFCGRIRPKKNKEGQLVVDITDATIDIFKSFLRFVYGGFKNISQIDMGEALSLLYISKKYMTDELTSVIVCVLTGLIDMLSVCLLLNEAVKYEEKLLIDSCIDFICDDPISIFNSEIFPNLSLDGLKAIVDHDDLCVQSECEVFSACKRWAQRYKELDDVAIRKALGDVLYSIRFPTMCAADFDRIFWNSDILTTKEKADIYHLIALRSDSDVDLEEDSDFVCKSRIEYPLLTCCPYATVTRMPCHNITGDGIKETLRIRMDQQRHIDGILIYGSTAGVKLNISI